MLLGTSTMLSFITLSSSQSKNLPKVSYIKVSEVWFLGCTIFIFGSMVEFAFVNTIWRRKKSVPVKKLNSKHILKSTLSPNLLRRRSHARSRSFSGTALHKTADTGSLGGAGFNNYLTVNLPITTIKEGQVLDQQRTSRVVQKMDVNFVESAFGSMGSAQSTGAISAASSSQTLTNNNRTESAGHQEEIDLSGWTTLTPQEIAMWIDSRARFVFPLSFLVFNLFFWTFVYCI